ncbi:MoaD/ThiS family protein [Mycobacterium paraterrae]|uniref:Molybdopterin synthase sulfur carrier subunit n=1 Tax=Mycobacterium paraterrae TaxID=577492 RepID=A0ABY3VDK4_9MYCO|nr:MoaD/ThiS family protein [Mycobacterium paraterrae]UMB67526.1 MoaD/ThiS family protein [Mycobacterium paraterrae]
MADVTTESIEVGVRYFAAAGAAAGFDSERLTVPAGSTVGGLVDELGRRNPELARVLLRCSYLCDGVAVRDTTQSLHAGNTVDVLPPFAGG